MPRRRGKREFRPYPDDEACPCGSGLPYKQCCKQKNFKFELDHRGTVHKALKLHNRLKPLLEDASVRFKKVFGRKPAVGDPILFDQHLMGDEDFWQQAKTIGRVAGVREELIFAWRRSGFIVGEHSRKLMSESDYQEWQDAIDEYFLLKEEGFDPFFVFMYLSGAEYEHYKALVESFDHTIIALGFALTDPKSLKAAPSYFRYLFVARAMRSLRTVREMYNTRYDDDCLSIARGVYEAYLRMKLLRLDPGSTERFEAMLAHEVGAYQTKLRKNGTPNYEICVDPESGKEFKITISNREILDKSDFSLDEPLYYDMYPFLSGFVHPELVHDALRSIAAKRVETSREGDPVRAIIFITVICLLLLLETSEFTFLRKKTQRDLRHVVKTLDKRLLNLITSDTIVRRMSVPSSIYRLFGLKLQLANTTAESGTVEQT